MALTFAVNNRALIFFLKKKQKKMANNSVVALHSQIYRALTFLANIQGTEHWPFYFSGVSPLLP